MGSEILFKNKDATIAKHNRAIKILIALMFACPIKVSFMILLDHFFVIKAPTIRSILRYLIT